MFITYRAFCLKIGFLLSSSEIKLEFLEDAKDAVLVNSKKGFPCCCNEG